MTDLNRSTSLVIHYMTAAGIIVLAAGLLLHAWDISDRILTVGAVILISAPMAGIVASTVCLAKMKDRYWLRAAAVLIAAVCVGFSVSYLG